ncbi:MAG: NnrS family protein, partial [Kiritimatiellia bacterium]
LLVVAMMGGRVIPGFTRGRIPGGSVHTFPRIERLAAASLILAAAGHLAAWPPVVRFALFAIAAGVHACRASGWFTPEIRREPLLWILHAATAWLVLGLLLHTLSTFGWVSPLLARHAFGAGTLGSICLGMMCRVTLGHTGRSILNLPRGTVAAFALIQLAAALRVLLPLALPAATLPGIQLSALCWIAAYGVYFIQYAPMLFLPRVDGKDG